MDLGFLKRDKAPEKNYLALRVSLNAVTAAVWSIVNGKTQVGKTEIAEISSAKVEDLLVASDKAISAVSEGLSVEVKEILFGVPPDWIVDGKLDELQLSALRRICKEMSFTPLGFVSVPEALVNFYKEVESTPLTAIIVGVDTGKLYLTLVRAGKVLGSQTVLIEPDQQFGVLIENGIKKFPESEVLPSRILIYDGMSDLQNLESQIVAYPWTQKLPFLHFPKVETIQSEKVCDAIAFAGGSQLGATTMPIVETESEHENVVPVEVESPKEPETKSKFSLPAFPSLPKINFPALPKFSFNFPKQTAIVGLVIGILVIVGLLFGGWYSVGYLTSADIVLAVTPKQLEGIKDVGSDKFTMQKIETSVTGTKKIATTGKKIVGEKAKGSVTIYGTTVEKKFPAGTILVYKTLKFTTDSSVTVASGSAATPATTTVNVTASGIGDSYNLSSGTLFDFADYPSSSYQAKNDNTFSGGSSRSISVVAKSDLDKLLTSLTDQLNTQAKTALQNQIPVGQQILDQATNITVSKKTYDRAADEESDSISLALTLKVTGVLADQKQLIELIPQLYADSIPAGYEFVADRATATIVNSKFDKAGNATLNVKFSANLLPKLDTNDIAKNIAGKDIAVAKNTLSSLSNVSAVTVNISPTYLAKFSPIPRNTSKIKVAIITP